jgi:hypothetical protein
MTASVFGNRKQAAENTISSQQKNADASPFLQRKTYFAMAGFLLIGLSLPIIELAMPVQYPPRSQNELVDAYATDSLQLDSGERVTASALKNFLETEPAATVVFGRALYPSYYLQGSFWGESSPNLLAASQFNRLQINLIGPSPAFVFIPLENAPQYFPHAADAFVVGCRQGDFIRALIIKVNDHVLTSSSWGGLTCSELE